MFCYNGKVIKGIVFSKDVSTYVADWCLVIIGMSSKPPRMNILEFIWRKEELVDFLGTK